MADDFDSHVEVSGSGSGCGSGTVALLSETLWGIAQRRRTTVVEP